MSTEVSLFGSALPFAPAASEEKLSYHSNYNSQWILLRILAQLAGMSGQMAPAARVPVDRSGTATGASQPLAAANTSRRFFIFQNPSTNAGTMWVDINGGTAVVGSPSLEVKPGQGFDWTDGYVPTGAISILGTNTEKWTAWEG